MKYILILAMLCLTACASTGVEKTSGTVGYPSEYTRVISTGNTIDKAKTNAFNTAIEIVVGSVVITNRESSNNQLIRDDIIKHSAGYVDDYKIISEVKTSQGYSLVVDVKVKSSKIAERLLGTASTSGVIDGKKIDDKFKSYENNKITGFKAIEPILDTYLSNGYIIKQYPTETLINSNRDITFKVPFEVTMNHKWVEALMEALRIVQDGKHGSPDAITVKYKGPNDWLGGSRTYWFNDSLMVNSIGYKLSFTVMIKATVTDKNNRVIHEQCYDGFKHRVNTINRHSTARLLVGDMLDEGYIEVPVKHGSKLSKELQTMSRVTLSLVPYDTCK